jgi:hypothetical protein
MNKAASDARLDKYYPEHRHKLSNDDIKQCRMDTVLSASATQIPDLLSDTKLYMATLAPG